MSPAKGEALPPSVRAGNKSLQWGEQILGNRHLGNPKLHTRNRHLGKLHTRNRHLGNPRGFVQWRSPMDCQLCFPTEFHLTVVFAKGLSLVQWMVTGIVQWTFSGIFQLEIHLADFRRVTFCPESRNGRWAAAGSAESPASKRGQDKRFCLQKCREGLFAVFAEGFPKGSILTKQL